LNTRDDRDKTHLETPPKIYRLGTKDGTLSIRRIAELAAQIAEDPDTMDLVLVAFNNKGHFTMRMNSNISAERLIMASHIIADGVKVEVEFVDEELNIGD